MTPADLVAACSARLQPLEAAANAAWWDANVNASDETQRRRAAADLALSDALADPAAFGAIRAARAKPGLDPLVARGLDLLEQSFAPNRNVSANSTT